MFTVTTNPDGFFSDSRANSKANRFWRALQIAREAKDTYSTRDELVNEAIAPACKLAGYGARKGNIEQAHFAHLRTKKTIVEA